jgi:bifunctional non-homologous end joining protein LigD
MVPHRIDPQLLTPASEPPSGDGWLHEVKYDGYRLLCRIEGGRARLYSRQRVDWTSKLPRITAAVEALGLANAYLDGELVAIGADGVPDFDALRRAIRGGRGALPLFYQAFDALYADGRSLLSVDLLGRKAVLAEIVRGSELVRYTDHMVGNGQALHLAAKDARLEGIVSKRIGSTYRPGARCRDWLKVKCFHRYTFVVAGLTREGAQLHDAEGAYVGTVATPRGRPTVGERVEVKALHWQPGRKLRHATLQAGETGLVAGPKNRKPGHEEV